MTDVISSRLTASLCRTLFSVYTTHPGGDPVFPTEDPGVDSKCDKVPNTILFSVVTIPLHGNTHTHTHTLPQRNS